MIQPQTIMPGSRQITKHFINIKVQMLTFVNFSLNFSNGIKTGCFLYLLRTKQSSFSLYLLYRFYLPDLQLNAITSKLRASNRDISTLQPIILGQSPRSKTSIQNEASIWRRKCVRSQHSDPVHKNIVDITSRFMTSEDT